MPPEGTQGQPGHLKLRGWCRTGSLRKLIVVDSHTTIPITGTALGKLSVYPMLKTRLLTTISPSRIKIGFADDGGGGDEVNEKGRGG
mmetsp:Transcript_29209/g.53659  ORF Transcript_29209/g.53659 Transcript_29209/m.53659 type:complete len:87 (-) Transcript_29209:190-450(-)